MISVIVPVYNAEKTINRCVDSILQQTFTDFELLLINDGSTDNSASICEEYSKRYNCVRVFHKLNGGVSSARNVGLDNSNGEWVTFCDSDDFVNPNWLDIYITSIDNNDADMVGQGVHRIGPFASSEYSTGVDYIGDNKGALNILCKCLLLGFVWNKIFKKSVLDNYNLRFDERFMFMEDENFVLRFLKHCKQIVFVRSSGYNYNMPDSSNKYCNVDNYYMSLSNFESVKYIYHNDNQIYLDYLNMVTNALFSSYSFNANDMKYRFRVYRQIVGTDIFKVEGLSFISKIICYLPLCLVDRVFRIKYEFRKNIF